MLATRIAKKEKLKHDENLSNEIYMMQGLNQNQKELLVTEFDGDGEVFRDRLLSLSLDQQILVLEEAVMLLKKEKLLKSPPPVPSKIPGNTATP